MRVPVGILVFANAAIGAKRRRWLDFAVRKKAIGVGVLHPWCSMITGLRIRSRGLPSAVTTPNAINVILEICISVQACGGPAGSTTGPERVLVAVSVSAVAVGPTVAIAAAAIIAAVVTAAVVGTIG